MAALSIISTLPVIVVGSSAPFADRTATLARKTTSTVRSTPVVAERTVFVFRFCR
jgi:hypothetical protein